jgi:hypothetical protein
MDYIPNVEITTNPRHARESRPILVSDTDLIFEPNLEDIPTNSLPSWHFEIENFRVSSGFSVPDGSTLASLGIDKSSIVSSSTHRRSSSFDGFIEKCIYNESYSSGYTYRILRLSSSNRAVFDIPERDFFEDIN